MTTKRFPHLRDPIALAKLIGDLAIGQAVDGKDGGVVKRGQEGSNC